MFTENLSSPLFTFETNTSDPRDPVPGGFSWIVINLAAD